MARQTFSGVHGMSMCRTPRCRSASTTAFGTAGVAPIVPDDLLPECLCDALHYSDLSVLHDDADQTRPAQVALVERRVGEVLVVEASHRVSLGGTSDMPRATRQYQCGLRE
jgi:hypothetical protein